MGWLSNFFGGEMKEAPAPRIKETPWAPEARSLLQGLMRRAGAEQMPLLEVPGMSEAERAGQATLMNIMGGGAFADPRMSPLYAGLREQLKLEEEEAASALRRRSQLGGMLYSSPSIGAEGKLRSRFAANRASLLGSLYEQERARDNPYSRLAAAMQYGALPRQIAGQQAQARYAQRLGTQMFPYETQAPLAQQMLAYQPWYQPQMYYQPGAFQSAILPLMGMGTTLLSAGLLSGAFGGSGGAAGNMYTRPPVYAPGVGPGSKFG